MHGNARSHTARRTVELFEGFVWDVLTHPPFHSPDLDPSDYRIFTGPKEVLEGERREIDDKVKPVVLNRGKERKFIEERIH